MFRRALQTLFYAPRAADGLNLRRWFALYLALMVALAAVAHGSLRYYDRTASPLALRSWLLALYVFYLALCCTFCPAPTAWIILLMASPMVGLAPVPAVHNWAHLSPPHDARVAAALTIALVAAAGAVGTALANLNEYHVFTFLLRFGRVRRVRHVRLYQAAERWFAVSPFGLLTLFSFLPIPVDVVRWLAIAHRYPRRLYALANFVGRFLRYALLAATATCLRLSWPGILAIQLTLSALVLLRYLPRLLGRRGDSAPPNAASDPNLAPAWVSVTGGDDPVAKGS